MAKGNMTTGGSTTPKDTVAAAMKKREEIAKQINALGIESTPERDALVQQLNLTDIEIAHRKEEAIEMDALKNASLDIRKKVKEINDTILENDLSRETLSGIDRKMSREQDNLRDKLGDIAREIRYISPDTKEYSSKMAEYNDMKSRIDAMTDKMVANQNRRREIAKENAKLRKEKQDLLP